MKFQTIKEAHDAYFAITQAWPAGPERDQAFLSMADVPVLAVDNHGHKYPVCIVEEEGHHVLYCVGAPSGWRLSAVREPLFPETMIAFDLGQNWDWINAYEVMQAVPAEFAEEE